MRPRRSSHSPPSRWCGTEAWRARRPGGSPSRHAACSVCSFPSHVPVPVRGNRRMDPSQRPQRAGRRTRLDRAARASSAVRRGLLPDRRAAADLRRRSSDRCGRGTRTHALAGGQRSGRGMGEQRRGARGARRRAVGHPGPHAAEQRRGCVLRSRSGDGARRSDRRVQDAYSRPPVLLRPHAVLLAPRRAGVGASASPRHRGGALPQR